MKHAAKCIAVFLLLILHPANAQAASAVYVVSAGDTLYKIAREHHTSVQQLIQANQLSSDRLAIGQTLTLPNATAVQPSQPAATPLATAPAPAQTAVPEEFANGRATVIADVLNVREQPSTNSLILGKLPYGMTVDVLQFGTEWTKIVFSGAEAYVASQYISVQTNQPAGEDIPADQQQPIRLQEIVQPLLGTPYVLGGTSPAGFDCSGFTTFVYGQLGVVLPRTSEEQFLAGQAVPLEQAMPGDLLFYDSLGKGRVSHVAMYMGDGMIVHANGEEVRYEKLANMHKLYPFYGVKRFLSEQL